MGTESFPWNTTGRGVTLATHPLRVPCSRKSRGIPLLPLLAVRPVQTLSALQGYALPLLQGITQRRKEFQPEDTYSCWCITWSIFVDELRSAIVRYELMRLNVKIETQNCSLLVNVRLKETYTSS